MLDAAMARRFFFIIQKKNGYDFPSVDIHNLHCNWIFILELDGMCFFVDVGAVEKHVESCGIPAILFGLACVCSM